MSATESQRPGVAALLFSVSLCLRGSLLVAPPLVCVRIRHPISKRDEWRVTIIAA